MGPGGEQRWWVIPEGGIGQLINSLTFAGTTKTLYTVKEATTRPSGAVGNSYSTQSEAQAAANRLNSTGRAAAASQDIVNTSNIGNPLNALGDLAHRLTDSSTWVRVGEFLAGAILLYVGAKAFFPNTVGNITGVATGTVKAAKAGLI